MVKGLFIETIEVLDGPHSYKTEKPLTVYYCDSCNVEFWEDTLSGFESVDTESHYCNDCVKSNKHLTNIQVKFPEMNLNQILTLKLTRI